MQLAINIYKRRVYPLEEQFGDDARAIVSSKNS
jgi:hypothetical protein